MIIKFLGTGPASPITNKKGKSNRLQSSALILHKKIRLLIDCTPSVGKQLKEKSTHLLITHAHKDAAGGLKRLNNVSLLATERLYSELKHRFPINNLKFVRIYSYKHKSYKLNNFIIKPFKVIHSKGFTTYGYNIKAGNKRIVYASDFKLIPKNNKKHFKNADLAVVDGAGWTYSVFDHQSIMSFLEISRNWNIKQIYFTQIGRRVPKHETAQRELNKITKNAYLAWDGMVIRV